MKTFKNKRGLVLFWLAALFIGGLGCQEEQARGPYRGPVSEPEPTRIIVEVDRDRLGEQRERMRIRGQEIEDLGRRAARDGRRAARRARAKKDFDTMMGFGSIE